MHAAQTKNYAPVGEKVTPYKRAAREWDLRIGATAVQAANWRRAAFASFAMVAVSLAGLIYLGAQPKAVPHIVEIDRAGSVSYRGDVARTWSQFKPSQAVVRYHLRRFIEDTRSLSFDPAVVKANWLDAYNVLTPGAANTLNTYAQEADPFKRARSERVTVDILSVVPLSADTWQADWKETSWDKSGGQGEQKLWRGTFHVLLEQPKTDEAIEKNPIGLYIQDFNFSRLGH